MVSAKEEPEAEVPPAVEGLLRVHKRIVDGLEGGDSSGHAPPGGKVSTRMLVPATQAGSLIGKQGATVKSIQDSSECIVRVLGPGSFHESQLFVSCNLILFMYRQVGCCGVFK